MVKAIRRCIVCSGDVVPDTRIIIHGKNVWIKEPWWKFRIPSLEFKESHREEQVIGYHCSICGLMYKFDI